MHDLLTAFRLSRAQLTSFLIATTALICLYRAADVLGRTAEITIDVRRQFQTIDGFGSSLRVFDDPHLTDTFDRATRRGAVAVPEAEQERILDLLYRDLGLSRVRLILEGGIEPENDNEDAADTDLAKFNFAWKRNDAQIGVVKRLQERGVTTYFPTFIRFETWMDENNPEEYVELAFSVLKRWQEHGVEPPYYSIVNEPGYKAGGFWSGEYIRDVIKMLGPKLRRAGIGTMFVVPDDLSPAQAEKRLKIILADAQARKYVGAIGFHLYEEGLRDTPKVRTLGEDHAIPLWMTEYSVEDGFEWANLIHTLLVEHAVGAVDHMWGFFGTWDFPRPPATITAYVGIEAAGHEYAGIRLTKQYYYTGQYSRFVRPGAIRIAADGAPAGLKASAYYHPSEATLSVVVLNTTASSKAVALRLEGAAVGAFDTVVRTSGSDNWAALPALHGPGGRFETILTPRSATTLQAPMGSRASQRFERLPEGEPRGRRLLAREYQAQMEQGDVRLLQALLATLGYDPGPADGVIGPRTRAAVRAFATREGLPEQTGPGDGALLHALSVAAAERASHR